MRYMSINISQIVLLVSVSSHFFLSPQQGMAGLASYVTFMEIVPLEDIIVDIQCRPVGRFSLAIPHVAGIHRGTHSSA